MLQVNQLTITYAKTLFKNLSFKLGNGEKVGLVGLNGTGKSTLLKIVAGEEKPDQGFVNLTKDEKLGYLPQEFTFDEQQLVGEFLESLVGYNVNELYRVNKVLGKLDWHDLDEFQNVASLSPGQKMKLYLAKLLISEPTILLLDEPTNHLDIHGIMWFEKFVQEFEGICIIISHDRAFLNNTINHVFEIDEEQLYIFPGNYDDYLIHKENFKAKRAEVFRLQERKRQQLDKLLENVKKIRDGKKRGKAVRAAKKRIEREVVANEINAYQEKSLSKLNLAGHVYGTKKILEINDLSFGYTPEKLLLNKLDLSVFGQERIWLFGANGIGKTTLIKLITGKLNALKGEITWGDNLNWTYFAQDEANVPLDQTVMNYFVKSSGIDYHSAHGKLEQFLFDKELTQMPIAKLSPGQKSRLAFAVFAQKQYDCMVLDEPTNHLDIRTKEVIEESLRNYQGAIILVSHDRYFSENINPTRILTIENGQTSELLL